MLRRRFRERRQRGFPGRDLQFGAETRSGYGTDDSSAGTRRSTSGHGGDALPRGAVEEVRYRRRPCRQERCGRRGRPQAKTQRSQKAEPDAVPQTAL